MKDWKGMAWFTEFLFLPDGQRRPVNLMIQIGCLERWRKRTCGPEKQHEERST
jgi:hypothetical protein